MDSIAVTIAVCMMSVANASMCAIWLMGGLKISFQNIELISTWASVAAVRVVGAFVASFSFSSFWSLYRVTDTP